MATSIPRSASTLVVLAFLLQACGDDAAPFDAGGADSSIDAVDVSDAAIDVMESDASVSDAPLADGSAGDGSVDGGDDACVGGGDCPLPAEMCRTGVLQCSGDSAICMEAEAAPNGTRCGEGAACWMGTCVVDECAATLGVPCDQVTESYIKASDANEMDFFGRSIALSGDTLAVGVDGDDSNARGVGGNASDNSAENSGAVYVFTRSGQTWVQQAYLKSSNSEASDGFGGALSLDGDTLVVGANGEDSASSGVDGDESDNSAGRAGAAYVFHRAGGEWTQQAYLKASNPGESHLFGDAVAVSGDRIAIGASRENSDSTGVNGPTNEGAPLSGAVYIFERAGVTWTQTAFIKASNAESRDFFGESVSLSGDTLAVGASNEDSGATGVDGDQSDNSLDAAGAVYVFRWEANVWTQEAYLKASNPGQYDIFGLTVSLEGDTLAVGAPQESSSATGVGGNQDDDSARDAGAVYVFSRTGTSWAQSAYIKASRVDDRDDFGTSLALRGDTLAVGADEEDSGDGFDSGAAFVFRFRDDTWSEVLFLKSPNTGSQDQFGGAIALDGSTLVVSALLEDSGSTGIGGDPSDDSLSASGAVYTFRVR